MIAAPPRRIVKIAVSDSNVSVRPAIVSDIHGIRAALQETWADIYQGVIPGEMQADLFQNWYSEDALRAAIRDSTFLVAVARRAIIGFIQLTANRVEGHSIGRIYVVPSYEHYGIGTRLLERALRDAGPGSIRAIVEERNEKAHRFYERQGFTPVDKRVMNFFGHGLPVITYKKP